MRTLWTLWSRPLLSCFCHGAGSAFLCAELRQGKLGKVARTGNEYSGKCACLYILLHRVRHFVVLVVQLGFCRPVSWRSKGHFTSRSTLAPSTAVPIIYSIVFAFPPRLLPASFGKWKVGTWDASVIGDGRLTNNGPRSRSCLALPTAA